jgi:nitrogen fixation/metabolism regulation signal transduction histidine kinase
LADIELGIVEEESLKEEALEIVKQTQELSKTIDDFRDFFRPQKVADEIFIADVFKDAFGVVGKSLENNNIKVEKNFQNINKIKTYSRELMQVFINILKNAKEALIELNPEDKKINIEVLDEDDGVLVRICNNGEGIKADIIDKIFDPYFSTKDEKNGTGLGLYMSKIIVNKHLKGTISAHNIDNGVCFEIRLPYSIR